MCYPCSICDNRIKEVKSKIPTSTSYKEKLIGEKFYLVLETKLFTNLKPNNVV